MKMQLGHALSQPFIAVPSKLAMLSSPCCFPIQIAAGTSHSLCLVDNGEIIAWGSNAYGQLGIGSDVEGSDPQRIPTFQNLPVASIACGGFHNICICSNGSVYSWGGGMYGQLGQGLNVLSSSQPLQIAKLKGVDIQSVSCGQNHSLFLSSNGIVYACGNGFYGQLGLDVGIDYVLLWLEIACSSFRCPSKNSLITESFRSPAERPSRSSSVTRTNSLFRECSRSTRMCTCKIEPPSRFLIGSLSQRKSNGSLPERASPFSSPCLDKSTNGVRTRSTQIVPL